MNNHEVVVNVLKIVADDYRKRMNDTPSGKKAFINHQVELACLDLIKKLEAANAQTVGGWAIGDVVDVWDRRALRIVDRGVTVTGFQEPLPPDDSESAIVLSCGYAVSHRCLSSHKTDEELRKQGTSDLWAARARALEGDLDTDDGGDIDTDTGDA